MANEFEYFVLSVRGGKDSCPETKSQELLLCLNPEICHFEEVPVAINKALFEENWKEIRSQSTKRWSLMAEHDLVKVDKAEVKFDKFVTMLQVKYGLTRELARNEINRLWTENQARNKIAKS